MTTDAQKEQKDALQKAGQSSGEKPPEPSTTPETLTREEATKLADEKHAKLDKKISEQEKALSRSTAAIEAAERRAAAAEEAQVEADKAKDKAALDEAKDGPHAADALSIYAAKVAARDEKATIKKEREALETDKRVHATDIDDARKHRIRVLADEIAEEKGVSADSLVSLTDGTEEKMRKAAEILPPVGQSQAKEKIPDSGTGVGGAKDLSEMTIPEQDNLSDAEWFKKREAQLKEDKK